MDDTLMSATGATAIRRMFLGLGGLILAIILSLFLLPYLLPGGVEKSLVSSALENLFHRPVIISGDAAFALFPKIQLSAENVVVRADKNGDQPVLADIMSVHLEVATMALLSSTLAIDRLSIDRPVLRLSRDRKGNANWRQFQSSPAAGTLSKPDYDWGWWREFRIGDVRLTGGRFVFDDRMRGRRITGENANFQAMVSPVTGAIDGLSVDGGMDVNGEPVRFRLDLGSMKKFLSGGRMPVIAEISAVPLSFRYQGTMAKRQYVVAEGQMSVDAVEVSRLEGWLGRIFATPIMGGLKWKSRFFTNGNRIAFEDMRLEIGEGRYSGNLRLDAGIDGYSMDSTINATTLNLGAVSSLLPGYRLLDGLSGGMHVNWGRISYGDLQFGKGELDITLLPEKRRIAFDLAQMKLYGGRASGHVRITRGEGMTSLDANIDLNSVNSRELLKGLRSSTPITGNANVHLGLFSVGRDLNEMLAAMRGQGEFNVLHGAITSADLAEHLRLSNREALEFTQLIGSFSINQGIIEGRDLLLKAPNLSLVGGGTVDLSRSEVDIYLQSLSRTKDESGKEIQKIQPFRMQGTLDQIIIRKEQN